MGLNQNLCHMLGVPDKLVCPHCNRITPTRFESYDTECGDPNPRPGQWRLAVCCKTCERDFAYQFKVLHSTDKRWPVVGHKPDA